MMPSGYSSHPIFQERLLPCSAAVIHSFSTTFSEADGVFFGKIEGIDGLVNFEGESVAELTNAFHEAVDDYLAYCTEEGIEPHKSYSGSLNVRLTPDIHTRVAYLAKQTGVSINSFIRTAVEKQIAAML